MSNCPCFDFKKKEIAKIFPLALREFVLTWVSYFENSIKYFSYTVLWVVNMRNIRYLIILYFKKYFWKYISL